MTTKIGSEDLPVLDDAANARTLAQMTDLFFSPEIERRRSAGLIGEGFAVYVGQVLFHSDGKTEVMFNEEIRGRALLRAPYPVEADQKFVFKDLEYVEQFELPDDLLDCGHFTVFNATNRWLMVYNFQTGRRKALDMLVRARQFLDTSIDAAQKGFAGPAVENLFTASELTSKAFLVIMRCEAADNAKTHGVIHSEINKHGKGGNLDKAFLRLFNRLSDQRHRARYGDLESQPPVPSDDDFDVAGEMIDKWLLRLAPATQWPSGATAKSR